MEHGYGILFYVTGCNKGNVGFLKIEHVSDEEIIHQGFVYWNWVVTNIIADLDDVMAVDYGALLPQIAVMESKEDTDFKGLNSKMQQ